MSAPKVYLAGPGVFRPNAKQIGERLKRLCEHHGLEGLWPADNDIPPESERDTPFGRASYIYRSNLLMIAECVAVVADISPFRGPHMDCGTAFEIGAAVASQRPVYAYTSQHGTLIGRMSFVRRSNGYQDGHGDLIEDFQLCENLMIACSVRGPFHAPELAISRCASELVAA